MVGKENLEVSNVTLMWPRIIANSLFLVVLHLLLLEPNANEQ